MSFDLKFVGNRFEIPIIMSKTYNNDTQSSLYFHMISTTAPLNFRELILKHLFILIVGVF